MIAYYKVKKFCKDNISEIENYENAINDDQIWHCHHKLGTDLNLTKQELIDKNLYYNRPANELIFLTQLEHRRIHTCGKPRSEETKRKLSVSHKGKIFSEEHIQHLHRHHTVLNRKPRNNEDKIKISNTLKNQHRHWMTNGIVSKCVPESDQQNYLDKGYYFGRTY